MRLSRLTLGAALALGITAGSVATAGPAAAVQTSTWGIMAAPGHTNRSSISDPANGGTVHDAVIVFNRTGDPITVRLSVLSATFGSGTYQYSSAAGGLASGISLGADHVTLGPHQQAQVPVTIREPRGVAATELAGIAAESAPIKDGALSVVERLVVLVKATPTSVMVPAPKSSPDLALWGGGAGLLLAGVVAMLIGERVRDRRYGQLAVRAVA